MIETKKLCLSLLLLFTPFLHAGQNTQDIEMSDAPSKLYLNVVNFLAKTQNANGYNNIGETLMHVAARENDSETIELLYNHGGNINQPDNNGTTPLHWAAGRGNEDAVYTLLSFGAGKSISMQDIDGRTPLARGAGVSTDVVYQMIHDSEMTSDIINRCDNNGMTPLHWAASGARIGALKLLIKYGANPNAQDYIKNRTALHWVLRMLEGAPFKGGRQMSEDVAFDMLSYLLEYGADPTKADNKGMTPIDWAIKMESFDIVKLLSKYAARA